MYKRCGKLGTEMFATYTFLQKRQHKNSQNRGKNPIVISRLDALIEGLLEKMIAREVIIDLLFEFPLATLSFSRTDSGALHMYAPIVAASIYTQTAKYTRESLTVTRVWKRTNI